LFENLNFDFVGKRKIAFILSVFFVILGFIAIVQIVRGKANLGIDFAGGTSLQIVFEEKVDIGDMRKALLESGIKDFELQQLKGFESKRTRFIIKLRSGPDQPGKARIKINSILKDRFKEKKPLIEKSEEIGPMVGKELQKKALIAILVAIVGILIYIAWRFELIYAIAATTATFHDVIVVLGIIWVLNEEINLLIVTALLTLAGYSLTDTVVVFDRIRENIKYARKEKLESIVNRSINEILSRTIVTSLTTLLVVVTLYVLGGNVIHGFSLALGIGIVVGTYSSIFVASPLLIEWNLLRSTSKR
jgi:preprotein translocase subunit SecF